MVLWYGYLGNWETCDNETRDAFVEPQGMVNSQHSTKGKTYQSKERGFPEMMEQCLLLGLVGTGIMERPYLCTSSPVYIKSDTSL